MGPCPFRHGYSAHKRRMLRRLLLQWGHALSGMDTRTYLSRRMDTNRCFNGAMPFQAWIRHCLAATREHCFRFNGAMPFQAWIRGEKDGRLPGARRASMGPCPFRHGYRLVASRHRAPPECFNGAMPFQAWIPCFHTRNHQRGEKLQWGHALSGMDTA